MCDGVSGRLRYELRATWLGGTRILDRLEQSAFDVFTARPTLGAADALVIAWRWHTTAPGLAQQTPRFSYAFLVLPPPSASAIGVVWDFCRAVDDAVDEAVDAATAAAEVLKLAGGSRPRVRGRARR